MSRTKYLVTGRCGHEWFLWSHRPGHLVPGTAHRCPQCRMQVPVVLGAGRRRRCECGALLSSFNQGPRCHACQARIDREHSTPPGTTPRQGDAQQ